MDFFNNHPSEVITVLSCAAISLITLGVFKARFLLLEEKVTRMDAMGTTYNRENGIKITAQMLALEHRTDTIENKMDNMTNILQDIRTDVKVIESWIQRQDKPHNRQH